MENTPITLTVLNEKERISALPTMFPRSYRTFEETVYTFARWLSKDYKSGFWEYYRASNGAFLMAPDNDETFNCANDQNGNSAQLSGKAFGLCLCLMVYSTMSMENFEAENYAEAYHALREAMFDCPDFDAQRALMLRLLD